MGKVIFVSLAVHVNFASVSVREFSNAQALFVVLTVCAAMSALSAAGAALYFARRWRGHQYLKLSEVRERIATDLHDDIGSSLSQVAILCEVLSRTAVADRDALQEIAGVSRDALASMSEIVWAVDPRHDHLRDLSQRMRWFAGETLAGRGISLEFTAQEPRWEVALAADTRRHLFLIFKECVHNIVRHASATQARVRLSVIDESTLLLIVQDNGRGFDPSRIAEGNGLRNISSRARQLDATVETRTGDGQGTALIIRVPLVQVGSQAWRLRTSTKRLAIN